MFIVKKNVDSSKFPIFFLCTKVGFFKIKKLRNDIAWWLKISIKIQFYTNNYSRGEKIHVM